MDIFSIVENTINDHNLIEENDKVLVGLSGGADSALLLRVLSELAKKYRFTLGAAHINHQLRETADRDEAFSKELCESLGVEFYSKKVDIKALASEWKMGEEECARRVRYEFFDSLGYDKIATAHNKNDVAETLLFNFMRGAGVKGLSGIPYRRENVIRPLLDVKKSDILEYSKKMGYDYVTDETNFEALYSRNKIRLNLIPMIEKDFNPAFVDVAFANARLIREDSEFLDELARESYKGEITWEMVKKVKKPILSRMCQLHYKKEAKTNNNLSSGYIDEILTLLKKNKTGHSIDLPRKMRARMEYGKLIIEENTENTSFEYPIVVGKVLKIPEIGKNILIKKCEGKGDVYLTDEDGLSVRTRRTGDVFFPEGMTGRKKLSDFFTDKKIPKTHRDRIPLLIKDGNIAYVIGYRRDRRYMSEGVGYKIEIMEEKNAD